MYETNYYQPQQYQQPKQGNYAVPAYMQPAPAPQTNNYLKCRPVSSLEEARAAQIDLDGSLHVFTDIGNKKIYTKQIRQDGTACMNIYSLVEGDLEKSEFITREEFKEAMDKLKSILSQVAVPASQPAPQKPQFNF